MEQEKPINRSKRPHWSVNRVAYSSGRGTYGTEFESSFGPSAFDLRGKDLEKEECLNNKCRELYNAKNNICDTYNLRIPGY